MISMLQTTRSTFSHWLLPGGPRSDWTALHVVYQNQLVIPSSVKDDALRRPEASTDASEGLPAPPRPNQIPRPATPSLAFRPLEALSPPMAQRPMAPGAAARR